MIRNLWGAVPLTAGRLFWVAPGDSYTIDGQSYAASNDNDGLDPRHALRTVNRAWALVSANVGDQIVLLPGTHTPSASIAANVAGVSMLGIPGTQRAGSLGSFWSPRGATLAAVSGDQTVNVTAADIEIAYIDFANPVDTAIDISAAGTRCHVHDCRITVSSTSTDCIGVEAIGTVNDICIERCAFLHAASGPGVGLTGAVRALVSDCYFSILTTQSLAVAIQCGAATAGSIIQRCVFSDRNGAITVGIDGTGVTSAQAVTVMDCRFGNGVATPIDNFDAAECHIAENYKLGVGATDGGTLVVVIT